MKIVAVEKKICLILISENTRKVKSYRKWEIFVNIFFKNNKVFMKVLIKNSSWVIMARLNARELVLEPIYSTAEKGKATSLLRLRFTWEIYLDWGMGNLVQGCRVLANGL